MWMNKKNDCPVCRTSIKSQTKALVVDSYIDKMTAFFSPEMKEKRAQFVKERKGMVKFLFHFLIQLLNI